MESIELDAYARTYTYVTYRATCVVAAGVGVGLGLGPGLEERRDRRCRRR